MEIRSASLVTLPEILRVWARADAERTVTDDAASLELLLRRDPDALLVAIVDGEVVATLIATWDGWRGHFYRLAVVPELRRRGIARALVRVAERRMTSLGARRLNAIVVETDETATSFWRATGFEQQSHRLRFVRNAGLAAHSMPG